MKRLRNGEISEINYFLEIGSLIRIFLDEQGQFIGKFFGKSKGSLEYFKKKNGIIKIKI